MTFEVGKTYRTKGGWGAKIDNTDGHSWFTAIHSKMCSRSVVSHDLDGTPKNTYYGDEFTLIDPDAKPAEPDYETRLRDQAALAYIGILKDIGCGCDLDAHDYNQCVHNFTDAFMAERKKRMAENDK